MEIVFYLIALGIISFSNIVCFLIGARTAQKAHRDEEIEIPTVNPMEIVKEHREKREAEEEQNKFNVMLENINNYSGDSSGQKDLPR